MVTAVEPRSALLVEGRKALWQVVPTLPDSWPRPSNASRMVAHLLFQRGFDDPESMADFLAGPPVMHDPFLLPDMGAAAARIHEAAGHGQRVAVWGDFDADGLTATAVLQETLRSLGLDPRTIIPHRDEGHGLDLERVRSLAQDGTQLLITVDCGIRDVDQIAAAVESGMDVIVTDHHEPYDDGRLPDAFVVSPTRLDNRYPFTRLAGSGVAYKVAQAVLQVPGKYQPLLDLVVLGTVADVVPLRDENRAIVAEGLDRLRDTNRPGLHALLKVAGVSRESLDGSSIGFYLGPRINAANRMADPDLAFRLLTTQDTGEADRLAAELDTHNSKRQEQVEVGVQAAIETVGQPLLVKEEIRAGRIDPIICLTGEWGAGISGLLASELTDRYCVPAMVGSVRPDGIISVSARSVNGVNVLQILEAAMDADPEVFTGYGGHAAACGFRTTAELLPRAFAELGKAARQRVPTSDLVPSMTVDAEVRLKQLNLPALRLVESLEPYGHEFEAPIFLARKIRLSDKRPFGPGGKHIRMKARSSDGRVNAVIFNSDPEIADVPEDQLIDAVFNLRRDDFGGTFAPQVVIRDWRLSDP